MLIWNVKQLVDEIEFRFSSCDLMLIWNVKQYFLDLFFDFLVVIWCLFEMWNSTILLGWLHRELWFDAYLKCETVNADKGI